MPYWQTETLERADVDPELKPVTRYAEADDVLAWLRELQVSEAPTLIVYRSHKQITQQEYEQGVG